MRVSKKGEWAKSGDPKSLIRHEVLGQNVGPESATRPRGFVWKEQIFAPTWVEASQLQRVILPPMTPVAEGTLVPNDPGY